MIAIRPAASPADYAAFGVLCRAYVAWCRVRYADIAWFIDEVFGYQNFDAEQAILRTVYGPPAGRVMVADDDGAIVASGAWRHFEGDICELKRVFVSDAGRGQGLGRRLTEALIGSARDAGYRAMRLDTGNRHAEALALYGTLGFAPIAPYLAYAAHLLPHFVFMERDL